MIVDFSSFFFSSLTFRSIKYEGREEKETENGEITRKKWREELARRGTDASRRDGGRENRAAGSS